MKKEYDFSKGERGKFYRENADLNIPIYLEDDVVDFVKRFATRNNIDTQTAVNRILRTNKEIIRSLE